MSEFFGGIFNDIGDAISGAGDVWGEIKNSGIFKAAGQGIEKYTQYQSNQREKNKYLNDLTYGTIGQQPGGQEATKVRAAQSVDPEVFEQQWLNRMEKFASIQRLTGTSIGK